MNPEAQRIAIAEACGFHVKEMSYEGLPHWTLWGLGGIITLGAGHKVGLEAFLDHLPDYLGSLDAMHEAEKVLRDSAMWQNYGCELWKVIHGSYPDDPVCHIANYLLWPLLTATAPQRAEALLKALDLWKP